MESRLSREELLKKIEDLEREVSLLRGMSETARSVSPGASMDSAANRMYDELFEFLPIPAFETDKTGRFSRLNARSLSKFGYSSEEVLFKKRFTDVLRSDARERMEKGFAERRKGIKSTGNEYVALTKNGTEFEVLIYSDGIFVDGEFQGIRGVIIDLSDRIAMENERKMLEEQLRHAKRVESVGRLAAGVAHDFNNLLSPIIGYSEVVIENLGAGHPLVEDMREILNSAHSAKEITRQLLTFGQKTQLKTESVDLNQVITDTSTLVRRLVPESIHIEYSLSKSACMMEGDSAGLKQILLNLFVNAGDAIVQSGRVSVSTFKEELTAELQDPWQTIPAGQYVVLKVCDDGRGMDKALQERIFEPFFSTKEEDGSGLGLSTVWGIARRHGGYVSVESNPGEGSCFAVYFPCACEVFAGEPVSRSQPPANGLSVLVVDDDERMCRLVRRLLTQRGYDVEIAVTVHEARAKLKSANGGFHLLLTDVVLPELDGKRLATELLRQYPQMEVLFMTGYGPSAMLEYDLVGEPNLLQKPFDAETLIQKVDSLIK
ncbi:MAG: response regulator [Deltaproteobacteria bacterium]|nr:response regulator [Deltaproteobacteria bacterium]MBN2673373.1 response regulator [Deltaproteobacteria bacterium]